MKKLLTIMILTIPIMIIINLIGLISVKAETVDYTYGKWRANDNGNWTSIENFGTSQSQITLNGISARFGWSTKFQAGTTYRVVVESGFKYISVATQDIQVLQPISVICAGSTSTSSWSADTSLIANCDYIGATRVANSNHVKYIIDITPLSTIIGLQVNINYEQNDRYMLASVNTYSSSNITYGESISSVIDEQTVTIVNNNNENTQEIINNNNQNTQIIMEGQKVCINVSKDDKEENGYLQNNGQIMNDSSVITTKYFKIDLRTTIKQTIEAGTDSYYRLCYYDINKTFISCLTRQEYEPMEKITIPNSANYVRFSINKNTNRPQFQICKNGNQALVDQDHKYNQENPAHEEQEENETLSNTIKDYFDDFQTGFEYNITIPTQATNFIWTIINRLTQMEVIRTFMISILCLGLVKMVLNR